LIRNIVHELGGSLIEANIHGYDKTTGIFQCYLAIEASAGRKVLNCRVSDAVAICHFAKIPIVVNSALLGELKVAD